MNAQAPLSPNPPKAPTKTRKPRVALMGEFSAGKSTLANVLLGAAPLPVRVTATRLPPVWISHGAGAAVMVDHDGKETPVAPEDIASVPLETTRLLRLQQEAAILELCDIIDMPGISDPNMPPSVWQSLIEEVDHVVWCTHATQAWRQSEAAVWQMFGEDLPGASLLLVTQIDKLRNDRDRGRVLARLRKETGSFFRDVFGVSLLQAVDANEDLEAWQTSGAGVFVERLVELLMAPSPAKPAKTSSTEQPEPIKVEQASKPETQSRSVPRRIVRTGDRSHRVERPPVDDLDTERARP